MSKHRNVLYKMYWLHAGKGKWGVGEVESRDATKATASHSNLILVQWMGVWRSTCLSPDQKYEKWIGFSAARRDASIATPVGQPAYYQKTSIGLNRQDGLKRNG